MSAPVFINVAQLVTDLAPGVLGPALEQRMGVWTAGCSLGRKGACAGCMTSDWHSQASGQLIPVDGLLELARTRQQQGGLVVSGGEPTDQLSAVLGLLEGYRALYPNAPVLLFSGRSAAWLRRHAEGMFSLADAVVAGPYQQGLPPTAISGSSNQRVLLNTALGAEVFGNWRGFTPRLQLLPTPGGKQARLIGIPDQGAKERLQAAGLWPQDRRQGV